MIFILFLQLTFQLETAALNSTFITQTFTHYDSHKINGTIKRNAAGPLATHLPKYSDLDKVCPFYDKVRPNGGCTEYLKNTRFISEKSWMNEGVNLTQFFATMGVLKVWLKAGNATKSFGRAWLKECFKNPFIQSLVNNVHIITLKDLQDCIFNSKESACLYYYPTCLYEKVISPTMHYLRMPRLICKELCYKKIATCNALIQFFF